MGSVSHLAVGITILTFLGACRSGSSSKDTKTENKIFADQTMERLHIQSYDGSHLEWELSAPKAEVFSEKGQTIIRHPEIELFEKGKKSTTLMADEGLMLAGETRSSLILSTFSVTLEPGDMFLSGHVVMVSTEGNRLMTDWAHYRKGADLIVSRAPVKIVRPDSTTEGIGLEATPDLSKVQIFNQTLVIKGKTNEKRN